MRRITAIGTLLSLFLTGVSAAHAEDPAEELRATLDGKPLAISSSAVISAMTSTVLSSPATGRPGSWKPQFQQG